jgi:hypothetical protein
VTYRAELSGRALKQMHGLPGSAFDSLIETMADVIDYPDDPLRTFPTSDPYVRRVEFGNAGLLGDLLGVILPGFTPERREDSAVPARAGPGGRDGG